MHINWNASLGLLMPFVRDLVVVILILVVIWVGAIRWMARGKVIAIFHANQRRFGGMYKIDPDNNCIWRPTSDDPQGERYDVMEDAIEMSEWPGGMPFFLQTSVRTLDYVLHDPIPQKISKHHANITAKTNKLRSDENVLRAVYLHAERSLGLKTPKSAGGLLVIMMLVVALISFGAMYMGIQANNAAKTNSIMLHNIQTVLGIGATKK